MSAADARQTHALARVGEVDWRSWSGGKLLGLLSWGKSLQIEP